MRYVHPNGDVIETTGAGLFTVTQNSITRPVDVSRWTLNTERWIENDIRAGYYEGFVKEVPTGKFQAAQVEVTTFVSRSE